MSHLDRIPYNATSPDEQRPRRDNDSAGDDWMDANPHREQVSALQLAQWVKDLNLPPRKRWEDMGDDL